MTKRFHVGDTVKLTGDALQNECYSAIQDQTLTITSVSTRYMPAKDFYVQGLPNGYHPGFDKAAGCALYDLETAGGKPVNVSLYDYELMPAKQR